MSRNKDTARAAALAAGEKTYIGRPCKQCGETVKYTSNHSCKQCVHTWRPKDDGRPCRNGHFAHRYPGSGHCSVCQAETQRRYRQNKRKAREARPATSSALAAFRAEQTAKQRRAMGLPA